MKSDYVILRSSQAVAPRMSASTGWVMSGAAAGMPDLSVEINAIERRELPALARDRTVLAAAPAMPMALIEPASRQAIPADAFNAAWGIQAVGADKSPFTGKGIVVAVLDTGIDAAHPAFQGVHVVEKDFTGEGNGDINGHGTHCAGTIFGRNVNGVRIGVAPDVPKALIGKVIGSAGGSSAGIVDAILWAVEEGAHVISMSLGTDYPGWARALAAKMPIELATSRALEDYRANIRLFESLSDLVAARGLFGQATVLVAAAGNQSLRKVHPDFEVAVGPPAAAEGIVSVAALGQGRNGFETAPFSNTLAKVSGPGVDIISAAPGGKFASMSGTSMAAPHVAGVACLRAQQLMTRGRLNGGELAAKLVGTATTRGLAPGYDPFDVGAGMVQAPLEA